MYTEFCGAVEIWRMFVANKLEHENRIHEMRNLIQENGFRRVVDPLIAVNCVIDLFIASIQVFNSPQLSALAHATLDEICQSLGLERNWTYLN